MMQQGQSTAAIRDPLVTGASRGMGRPLRWLWLRRATTSPAARSFNDRFGPAEPYVLSWPRTLDSTLEDVTPSVQAAGGAARPVQMDLTDRTSSQAGAEVVLERFGWCDVCATSVSIKDRISAALFLDTPTAASPITSKPAYWRQRSCTRRSSRACTNRAEGSW